jgi:SAM-dependent methyltransferase
MTLSLVGGALAARRPFPCREGGREAALRLDAYVLSRERYKDDLVQWLTKLTHGGLVLEASNGYGSIGISLAETKTSEVYTLCECQEIYEIRQAQAVGELVADTHYQVVREIPPDVLFDLIYSVNTLHEWENPALALRQLFHSLKPGGSLVINDLRRDGDPFITEYVIRELAADSTETGQYYLTTFLASLCSAYSARELRLVIEESGLEDPIMDTQEPITITATIRKGV